ncbi:MAG: hypothetical protein VX589_09825, partial [Myxococcota bacterium]|nr:hypothetical protein [Myxococcota bacterium]
ESTAALVAVACEVLGQPYVEPNRRIDMATIPSPVELANMGALEAAARVTRLADDIRGRHDAPQWIRAFQLLGHGEQRLDAGRQQLLDSAFAELDKGELGRGYRQLVNLQQDVCQFDLTMACELGCLLEKIEAQGLPKKLAFSPTPPQEERSALAAEIFLGLAIASSGSGRAARLAVLFFDGAIDACEQTHEWIRLRHERGAQRAADADRMARLATINAIAMRCKGDLDGALVALKPSLARAERAAFGNPLVTIAVLEEAAVLYELRGELDAASRYYESTVLGAIPGFQADLSPYGRSQAVEVIAEQPERILHGIRGLAGWARSGPKSLAAHRLNLAREVLALAADTLRGHRLTEGQLVIELAAATLGHVTAAPCALEAARVLGDPCGVALAFMSWAESFSPIDDEDGGRVAVNLLDSAAASIRSLDWGPFRATLDLRIARVLFDRKGAEDGPRIEAYLRRIGEGFDTEWHAGLGWRLAPYLRGTWTTHFNALMKRLEQDGMAGVGYGLLRAARRQALHGGQKPDPGKPVGEHLLKALTARWVTGEQRPFPHRGRRQDHPVEIPNGMGRRRQSLRRGDCRLELSDVDEVIWLAMKGEKGESIASLPVAKTELIAELTQLRAFRDEVDASEYAKMLVELSNRYAPYVSSLISDHERLFVALPAWAHGFMEILYGAFGDTLTGGIALVVDGTALTRVDRAEDEKRRIAICGDAATGRDLQLSTLADADGYDGIAVHYGDALGQSQLAQSLADFSTVHLVGETSEDGAIQLSDGAAAVRYEVLGKALGAGHVQTVTVMGPIKGQQCNRIGRSLLPGLTCGLFVRHSAADADRQFVLALLRASREAASPRDAMRAWSTAYRNAQHDGVCQLARTGYFLLVHDFI